MAHIDYHIIHNDATVVVRMLPYDAATGITLHAFTHRGLDTIALPPDALRALLLRLPQDMIIKALTQREAPAVRMLPREGA